MRLLLLGVVLAVSVRASEAQNVLFVSAAAADRVDTYAVRDDGSLSPSPIKQRATRGPRPRRLLVSPNTCNLYVAESDRVEVFRIHAGGTLELIGATRKSGISRSHDIKLADDLKTLYVPLRRLSAIAAYPLDDQGIPNRNPVTQDDVPAGGPTSCVYAVAGADWEDIGLANGKFYGVWTNKVDVYATVPGKVCSTDLTKSCTTDAECFKLPTCSVVAGDVTSCSNDTSQTCETDADCQVNGSCFNGFCATDTGRPCTSDADCPAGAGFCAAGQLIGALPVNRVTNCPPEDDDPVETCANYQELPATTTTACIEPDAPDRPKRPEQTCTFSSRGDLAGGVGLVVSGNTLVVGLRYTHKLQGFTLQDDGNFPPITTNEDTTCKPTNKEKNAEKKARKPYRTNETVRYIGLTLFNPPDNMPILYGAGPEGRTDAFRLDLIPPESVPVPTTNPAYRLPKNPTSGTFRNIVSTPVRSAIGYKKDGNPVLYVAGGELDRVQIFFLGPDGGIQPDRHIDEPQDIDQSYPNDVVFKDITGCD